MIKKLTDFSSLSGVTSPLLPLIYVDFLNNRSDTEGAFVQFVDEVPSLLFSMKGGCVNLIVLSDGFDEDELMSFLGFFCVNQVVSDFKITSDYKEYPLYKAENTKENFGGCDYLNSTSALGMYRGIYSLLNNGEDNFDIWYTDFSRKLNNGNGEATFLRRDDNIVSCAVSPAVFGDTAIIGGVATRGEYQKQGFASSCVCGLVDRLFSRNVNNIYLWCQEKNRSFYENNGFVPAGSVYICEEL